MMKEIEINQDIINSLRSVIDDYSYYVNCDFSPMDKENDLKEIAIAENFLKLIIKKQREKTMIKKVMMLKIYIGEDELGEHISIDGIIDGKDYSLGSMDIGNYPETLHEALLLPEIKDLAMMLQKTKLDWRFIDEN